MPSNFNFALHQSSLALQIARPIQNNPFLNSITSANLGPLHSLVGNWVGTGFNTIWRPHQPGVDHVLQLNVTAEKLVFEVIDGPIPNRGMVQGDINLFGLTYVQKISDTNTGDGIHVEPGIWAVVPSTTNPNEVASVVRMASIPHGTTLLAQGVPTTNVGAPTIPPVDITPFSIAGGTIVPFPAETNLSLASINRIPSAAQPQTPALLHPITQAMVNNPNSVLTGAISGQTILSTTTLSISTMAHKTGLLTPVGGGTNNIAFLQGGVGGPNAEAVEVNATFWIETVAGASANFLQLQYSQTVFLNFNGLSWPHVSVATLKLVP